MIIGIASADYLRADRSPTGEDAWGGSGWARVGQYLPSYREAGHTVIAGTLWRDDGYLAVEDAYGLRLRPDVIIMQRIMHDGVADAIRMGQAAGQVVINDLDDWYWGLDPQNAAFNASHPKLNKDENTTFYGSNLAASNLLTVSTPYLADRISRRVKCPIVIVPNYVDVSRFTPVVQSPGVPTFGWAGSTGHRSGDIETIAGVFRRPIEEGTIKMHHSGNHIESPSFASMLSVRSELITTTPRCGAAEYPNLLTFDVGLVPLRDTPFNNAKSEIKGLEYAAAGIPFIAQSSDSYSRLHSEWDGAFHLARRPKDWIAGIKRYQDYDRRLHDQAVLLDKVKTRDLKYGATQWIDILEGTEHAVQGR